MEERAELVGPGLRMRSTLRQGVTVRIELPLRNRPEQENGTEESEGGEARA